MTLSGTSLTGTVQPGTQGRHTVGFDTAGVRKPAYFSVQAALQAAAGGTLPSAQSAVQGETQRYYADGNDQNNGILAVQPTMQWHTSLSGVANGPEQRADGDRVAHRGTVCEQYHRHERTHYE